MTDRPRNALGQYEPTDAPPLDVAVIVKCTREEREGWRARAGAAGLTLSALIRRLLG